MSKFEKVKEYYDRGLWSKNVCIMPLESGSQKKNTKKLLARNMLPKYKNSVL